MEINRIIALRGKGDTGKTTTLCMVIDILKEKGAKELPHSSDFRESRSKKEKSIVFKYCGKTVAVITAGDSVRDINREIHTLERNYGITDVDILLCACRSEGDTDNWVKTNSPIYEIHNVCSIEKSSITNNSDYRTDPQINDIHLKQAEELVKLV